MENYVIIDGLKLKRKVRAIITNQSGYFLLIRPHGYDEDSWTFIGGGVEEGESEITALHRELKEEANIDVISHVCQSNVVNWFAFSKDFKEKKGFDYDGQHASYFHVVVPDETNVQIQKEEVSDFCWCNEHDVLERIKVPVHADIFKKIAQEFGLSSIHSI